MHISPAFSVSPWVTHTKELLGLSCHVWMVLQVEVCLSGGWRAGRQGQV